MRVLAIGNMYPPHHLGGYELIWRAANDSLRRRGDEVRVLTSDHREPQPDEAIAEDPDAHRQLRWYWREHTFPPLSIPTRLRLERHNLAVLDRHLAELRPDVVAWWAMGGMSMSLIEAVRRRGLPAVGFVHDEWLVYGPIVDAWHRFANRRGLPTRLAEALAGVPCRVDFTRAATWVFVSETTRRHALAALPLLERTAIAHSGVDSRLFTPHAERRWQGSLLYVGRIDERKGIATAIRAVALLADCRLTVLGGGDERHLGELRRLTRELGVEARVEFGRRRRDQLPAAYGEADALVFPVLWEEPWGLVPLEAMASGTPVLATGAGGSGEFLREGENCLLFDPPGDPGALAAAVERLAAEPQLRRRLRDGGLRTAERISQTSFEDAVAAHLDAAATAHDVA